MSIQSGHFSKKIIQYIILIGSIVFFMIHISCVPQKKEISSESIHITASFYPLYIMLMNITNDIPDVSISLLAPQNTGCLHDYQLTVKDMLAIEKSDILVLNGAGMETFLDKALAAREQLAHTGTDTVIIASKQNTLINNNAHVWVSIDGAITEVLYIADELSRLDPAHTERYQENARIYITKLVQLQNEMHENLKPFAHTAIITFHEAFPYFAAEFALDIVAHIEREPGMEPTAKELQDIMRIIRQIQNEGRAVVLFAEPQYSSASAQIIARETGLTVYELDPAVSGELNADAYITAMRTNMRVLESALGNVQQGNDRAR